ncbi:MAG TPA: GNAT family N-acetyltransferase [Puia sp.]|nr:GNAT family N-acetyltransferase [Puia sp.]
MSCSSGLFILCATGHNSANGDADFCTFSYCCKVQGHDRMNDHQYFAMRTPDEIKKIILDNANSDNRIRAVLLNGSRANQKLPPDDLQDFDIMYIVHQMDSFLSNHDWTSIFGEKLIWQLPDEMNIFNGEKKGSDAFHYLMLFNDGNRIDLTLFPREKMETDFSPDSLTVVWLDKDNLFEHIEPATDSDYRLKKPTEKEFIDACNEFWWVSAYIAKGLSRDEIPYAKAIMEGPVKKMFLKMTEWYIGTKTEFSVSSGLHGKYIRQYLSDEEYTVWLKTYPDAKSKNIWNALFLMTGIFKTFALSIAEKLNFRYNETEQENAISYLQALNEKAEGKIILRGKSLALIPVEEKYLDELLLFSANPVIWEHLPREIYSREELWQWYQQTKEDEAAGKAIPFLIQNNQTLEIMGSTRILDLDIINRKAEIGWTWINPKYFGSKINTEAKLLLMNYAFTILRLNRIQFRADERNIRSRRAILKLGATFEAELRNFKQRRDGSVGNAFLFSIISPEWEMIEKKLREQLE